MCSNHYIQFSYRRLRVSAGSFSHWCYSTWIPSRSPSRYQSCLKTRTLSVPGPRWCWALCTQKGDPVFRSTCLGPSWGKISERTWRSQVTRTVILEQWPTWNEQKKKTSQDIWTTVNSIKKKNSTNKPHSWQEIINRAIVINRIHRKRN